jgi:hypothetical protein
MVVLAAGLFFVVFGIGGSGVAGRSDNGRSPGGGGSTAPRGGVDLERRVTDFTAGFGAGGGTAARGGYRPPSLLERTTIADGVGLLLEGRRSAAVARLAEVDYVLRTLTDSGTGRSFAEIADARESGTGNRGWGRVYADLGAPVRWSVQVPHPVADQDSEKIGVGVLRGTPGGVMVLAGAHRDAGEDGSADVAHRADTVFDAICTELVHRGLPGVQVHGFADATEPHYDVLLSTGKGSDAHAAAVALARGFGDHGLDVCRAWTRDCTLEGRTNAQSAVAAAAHVPFLHAEFSRSVRDSPRRIARAVAALEGTTAGWNRGAGAAAG